MMPVLMITGVASAQEYKLAVQNPKDTRLVLKDFSGQLPVEGYNGTEIVITSNSGRFEPPEKAKGLKPIFPGGTDNTGIGLEVLKSDNLVKITCLVPFTQDAEYKIKVPENLSLEMSSGCERSNDITITGMKNEIDINSCHDINLKNISGPVVLSTISGDINITYSSVSAAKATSVNSVSGDIDITLPVKTAVDLELRTVTGAFYSDFDFSQTQKDLKRIGGNEMNYSLNGGGFKFTVGTVSGNIYLRKGI
jgi:lia operon protein LiaG